jgi:pimeloyl-ACP methyl ester carboxylesterase
MTSIARRAPTCDRMATADTLIELISSMTDQGRGTPVVLIPGIQGRWEWMAPAIRALARTHRVLSFSLGEVQAPDLFDKWTSRVDELVDRAGSQAVAIVGVSFGGLVAAYYAARRPRRVSRLVLVSTPGPEWKIDRQSAGYVRFPRLALPLFASRAVGRLLPEVTAALPTVTDRARFSAGYAFRAVRFPVSPREMAAIVREWERTDLANPCRAITAPTLVVTGEPGLDRVVPVESSLAFTRMIPGARHMTLPRTGHVGLVSRPEEFAAIVTDFVDSDAGTERDFAAARRSSS